MTATTTRPCHFESLPTELILNILDHHLIWPDRQPTLYACSLINKTFHDITNPLLWYDPCTPTLDLLTCLDHVPAFRQSPGRHVRILRSLLTRFTDILGDEQFIRLVPHLSHMVTLTLNNGIRVTDQGLQQLVRSCPHLKTLELNRITLTTLDFAHLDRLYFHQCTFLGGGGGGGGSSLKELSLNACHIEPSTIMNMLTPTLTSLQLTGISRTTMESFLLTATTTATTSLEKVVFSDCWDIDDTIWLAFLKMYPQLQDISIQDSCLTDSTMISMIHCLPKLKRLRWIHASNITSHGIRLLVHHAGPSLVCIECHDCTHIRASHFPNVSHPSGGHDDSLWLDTIGMVNIKTSLGFCNKNDSPSKKKKEADFEI